MTVSRSRLLAGGLVVAVLVAAVVTALVLRNRPDEPGRSAPVDYSAVAPVPGNVARACPPPGRDLPYPADGILPDGAVAVRLCNGPPQRTEAGRLVITGFDAPDDVLTSSVAGLVELVNSLEAPPETTGKKYCPAVAGWRYAFWFLYPGGDARAVLYDAGGCSDLTTGPGRVIEGGGSTLAEAFQEGLLAQRVARTPPGTDEAAGCNPADAPASPVPVSGRNPLATLTYCALLSDTRVREGHLTGAQVRMVNRDIRLGETSGPCTGRGYSMLQGFTVWGDRVALTGKCHSYVLGSVEWTASPRVGRMLARLSLGPPERQCAVLMGGRRGGECPHG